MVSMLYDKSVTPFSLTKPVKAGQNDYASKTAYESFVLLVRTCSLVPADFLSLCTKLLYLYAHYYIILLLVHFSLAICYLSKPHNASTNLLGQSLVEDLVLLKVLWTARKKVLIHMLPKRLLQNLTAETEPSEET